MRVFITGGTGYVGQAVVQACLEHEHEVVLLVRPDSEKKSLGISVTDPERVQIKTGDVLNPESISDAMSDCDAVIHLVGIIRELPSHGITFEKLHVQAVRNVIEAARSHKIRRYVHMSALGAHIGSASGYSHSKGVAEKIVQESGLDWTIFRPSVIFGNHSEFVTMLADMVRKTPIIPVIGTGMYRLQPVSLANVAEAFAQSLTRPDTTQHIYEVGGPVSYSYDEMLDEIASALGKKRGKLHIPLYIMQPIVRALERFPFFPITSAQLNMLLEGSTCDPQPFYKTFNTQPISFTEGISQYL